MATLNVEEQTLLQSLWEQTKVRQEMIDLLESSEVAPGLEDIVQNVLGFLRATSDEYAAEMPLPLALGDE